MSLITMLALTGCSAYTVGGVPTRTCVRTLSGHNASQVAAALARENIVPQASCAEPYVDIAIAQERVPTAFDSAALVTAYRYDYKLTYQWHENGKTTNYINRESLNLYRSDVGVKQTLNATALRNTIADRLAERIRLQISAAPSIAN